jgi:uncharacterized protein (DUF427 family)
MKKENVKDYPLPPKVEKVNKEVRIIFNEVEFARSSDVIRILQKNLLPVYYISKKDIKMQYLKKTERHTTCEYKGVADYFNIEVNGKIAENAAFYYPNPKKGFEGIENYISFYPAKMDECYVGSEKVDSKIGLFTGEWATSEVEIPERLKR